MATDDLPAPLPLRCQSLDAMGCLLKADSGESRRGLSGASVRLINL